jgi:hypothetical protein
MSEEDRAFIEAVRRSREEEARFFSNQSEMDRWTVREFLTRLGVVFCADELISPPENDTVDVVFRAARFQVKEIYDPAERRDAETRESLKLAKQAVTTGDLFPPLAGRDLVVSDLAGLIGSKATSFKYPPRERAALDLLCYVTRPYSGFNEPLATVGEKLSGLGWRSISCLLGHRAYVLTSSRNAPDFLRER